MSHNLTCKHQAQPQKTDKGQTLKLAVIRVAPRHLAYKYTPLNDTQHNGTQHHVPLCVTFLVVTLSVVQLSVAGSPSGRRGQKKVFLKKKLTGGNPISRKRHFLFHRWRREEALLATNSQHRSRPYHPASHQRSLRRATGLNLIKNLFVSPCAREPLLKGKARYN